MSDPIQPPPGYTAEPPSEAGEYKIWCTATGEFSVAVVRRERNLIYVWGDDGKVCVEDIACLWGPKVEF